jgi:(2Fe-2S) ferredoxin
VDGDARHGTIEDARAEAVRRGVGGYARHVFICTGPDCCSPEQGLESWTRLKAAVAELNKDPERPVIYRTKVGCLRICTNGPTGVIYPEGTWYGGLSGDGLDRVIREDLGNGRQVSDLVIGHNPLGGAAEQ